MPSNTKFFDQAVSAAIPAAGDTTLVTIPVFKYSVLCFQFAVATQALDNFDVLVKCHPDGTVYSDITPTNWAALTAGARFRDSSGNLAAQAAASTGYFSMYVDGLEKVRINVSAAVDGALVTARWSLA